MLKGLQLPLWLCQPWYNKGCIHRLANPHKGCVSIVISIRRSGLCDCAPQAKSDIYDCLVQCVVGFKTHAHVHVSVCAQLKGIG